MIISGASRSNGAFFAQHLMRADHNERVEVVELRGFAFAEDVPTAFLELRQQAIGTNCKNYFYHADLNPREGERLSPEQWAEARDMLARELGLQGQPCLVVEHEKDGRTHQHVIWSRINADTMTAIHDGHNYRKHEEAARAIEAAFSLTPVERCLTRDKEQTPRQARTPADWETFRAQESGLEPQDIRTEVTELWRHSDNGLAFAAALEERGYILARGDRRDFCIIDREGDEHSLARRISGVKAAEIRARMEGVDRDALPSVAEARAMARTRLDEGSSGTAEPQAQDTAPAGVAPVAPTMADPWEGERAPRQGAFAEVMGEVMQRARAAAMQRIEERTIGRAEPYLAWLGVMREHVRHLADDVRDYWRQVFHREEAAPETPTTTVTGAQLDSPQRPPPSPMEPSL